MKSLLTVFCILILSALAATPAKAEVTITRLDDCFRVEVDGKLFTEWQFKAWKAPYLYPVIGPNGENITRHYPMKDGVPNESQDHPHHRGIRFSHRNVNGLSFWAPDSDRSGHNAGIVLDRVESMTPGKTGELVLWNRWMGNGELVLREKVRLAFTPLPNREMLMDFDVELHPAEKDVTFFDEKDGGLGIRVAGTMKVEDRKTKKGGGTIVTSRGDKNEAAWGTQAEWADYFGPDPSGKVVGVAIFDHPSNFRHPVHWHARTYGLITANHFGKGFFEAKKGAKKGDGDYTIKTGEKLLLRHRLFFHHGDPESAGVAARYQEYAGEKQTGS